MKYLSIIFVVLLLHPLQAQEDSENSWAKKLEKYKIQPIASFQLWSTYTVGTEVFDEATGKYEAVDDRLNMQIRRIRLGIKGQPYKNLKFNINTAFDFVGRDLLSGTDGGVNNGASPQLRLWNAFMVWKISDKNDAFHLTSGFFAPQIGRESITGASKSTSMEKAWSQNYLRRHLVGVGPGRAIGMNLGGMFLNENKNVGVSYDVGLFNPVFISLSGNSAGGKFSPLTLGRVVFHFGNPEFEKYSTGRRINYFGKRRGISLALSAAVQGETDLFERNSAYGLDWLFNWENFNLDGEWSFLERDGSRILGNNSVRNFTVTSNVGYVRLSYNFHLENSKVLEPIFMIVQFNGALDAEDQADAAAVNAFAGNDYSYDAGLNYYLNPSLKISLHYTWRQGDAGDAGDGATFNNYFFQGGVGAYQRGDWLGLGVVVGF